MHVSLIAIHCPSIDIFDYYSTVAKRIIIAADLVEDVNLNTEKHVIFGVRFDNSTSNPEERIETHGFSNN